MASASNHLEEIESPDHLRTSGTTLATNSLWMWPDERLSDNYEMQRVQNYTATGRPAPKHRPPTTECHHFVDPMYFMFQSAKFLRLLEQIDRHAFFPTHHHQQFHCLLTCVIDCCYKPMENQTFEREKKKAKCSAKLLNLSHGGDFILRGRMCQSISTASCGAEGRLAVKTIVDRRRLQHFQQFIKNWKWKGACITELPFANMSSSRRTGVCLLSIGQKRGIWI